MRAVGPAPGAAQGELPMMTVGSTVVTGPGGRVEGKTRREMMAIGLPLAGYEMATSGLPNSKPTIKVQSVEVAAR